LDHLLRAELAGKLPYAVEDAVISCVQAGEVFGEGEPRQEVIVAAASRETIDGYLEMAAKARLEVAAINIESCALVECFGRLFHRTADAARTILFIDLGACSTQVCLTQGDKLVFARNLNLGEKQIDQALASGMGMDIDQAHSLRWDFQKGEHPGAAQEEVYRHMEAPLGQLTAEIVQCLRYYETTFRNQPVERMILAGGQANDKRLCQSLAERLNLPAQIGDPLMRIGRVEGAGLQIGLDRREPHPQWAVAVGLSLGAAA
jgi:type IV pilus assembly protein PilM